MKKAKRLVSLLLAFVMLLSLTVVVGAATVEPPVEPDRNVMQGPYDGGKITISNAVVGEDYTLYQILYLANFSDEGITTPTDGSNPEGGKYSYMLTEAWKDFLDYSITIKNSDNTETVTTIGKYYLKLDAETNTVTWAIEGTDSYGDVKAAQFALFALQFAKEKK